MEHALSGSRRNLLVAAALAVLGLAAWLLLGPAGSGPGASPANADPVKPLDHFLCYQGAFKPATAVGAAITLKDEFSAQPVAHKVGTPRWFCNPAEKQHPGVGTFPITHPNNHLTAYGLDGRVPPRSLRVTNQFQKPPASGGPNLVTDPGTAAQPNHPVILVPTQKLPLPAPADINHFKCYKTKPVSIDQQVVVRDQWSGGPVVVQQAVMICNPAAKTHGSKTYPILHPNQHLVCYTISPFRFPNGHAPVTLSNQFGRRQFTPVVRFMLCVPSTKSIVH
jgi:hypothetical protein